MSPMAMLEPQITRPMRADARIGLVICGSNIAIGDMDALFEQFLAA